MSVHLKVRAQSPDFHRPSYNRPMVLMFPDMETADDFHTKHATCVSRSCVIMKNRRVSDDIQNNLSTSNVGMVLVEMPHQRDELVDLLAPYPLNSFKDDLLLCLSIASYSLFFYVLHYHINHNKNLEMHGIVINPSIEFQDPQFRTDIIMKYLNEMYNNS
jgi:hypothetical protein